MSDKMSDKSDYFDFVSTVLGVKSIYIEDMQAEAKAASAAVPAAAAASAGAKEVVALLVTVENLAQYSAEEKELLEKMISALKIDLNKVKVTSHNSDIKQFEYGFLLKFADQPVQTASEANSLSTFSPRTLLKNPSLKKQVWNEFQTIIKFFSN